ncbi:MAG: hypothetical protein MI755_03615 [Sphingomonadales bacterium]|nr:hypothetical protein [Sphingomonadales bacterium]
MLPASVRDEFIGLLAETGNVSQAARLLGINRMTAYGWREDPEFADLWDAALQAARQGLRERVVETACALGIGEWVPELDPETGRPLLDDDFEPVMRFETRHVDARVLMKLMDKTMRDEVQRVDQRTAVAGRFEHVAREGMAVVYYDVDGRRIGPADEEDDVEDTEAEDGPLP